MHITGNILWGFIPLPEGPHASCFDTLPEKVLPDVADESISFKMRDLPYSFDFLVENFMDPAHIPFAHHSLQGVREDGSPIPMQVLTDLDKNATHCEVHFKDKIRGRYREGVVSFSPPCFYHFRTKRANSTDYKMGLVGLVVPTQPGKCRLIFGIKAAIPAIKHVPKWLDHVLSNRFVDTDLWVHEQELYARNRLNPFYEYAQYSESADSDDNEPAECNTFETAGPGPSRTEQRRLRTLQPLRYKSPPYALPTQSDKAVVAWRHWWAKHM